MVSVADARGSSERHGRLKAIGLMLVAVAAFACMDATLKMFSEFYPPMQVSFLRGLASLPFMVLPTLVKGRYRELKPVRFGMHLLRGALMFVMLVSFVYAVRALSLANVYSIYMAEPLVATALSVPLLGDRVSGRNWAAIVVGLVGVVVILQPSGSGFITVGALAAFISATAYALSVIALRVITRTDSTTAVIFWTIGVMTVATGIFAVPHWTPVAAEHWKWLVVLGVFGAIGQRLMTEAFRAAPPAIVSPFEYTSLLWGIGIDWVFWSALPPARVYVGGSIVIASGLYLIWHEHSQQPPFDKSCVSTPAP